jgi:outer membrane lipopolysaccharide assembly protein LptE/RlpB
MTKSEVRPARVRAMSRVPMGLTSSRGSVPALKSRAKLGRSCRVSRVSGLNHGIPAKIVFLVALCVSFSACGYHTAGHANLLPSDLRTIAIPAFLNQTQTYKVEQTLTASVVQEFVTRTSYHITSDPKSADATLHGIVLSTYTNPLTYDTKTGRASSILVVVSLSVSLKDRQGRVLYQNPSYTFREQYQVSQELSSFFEEGSPAFQRLSKDFARTLVSNLLEAF